MMMIVIIWVYTREIYYDQHHGFVGGQPSSLFNVDIQRTSPGIAAIAHANAI